MSTGPADLLRLLLAALLSVLLLGCREHAPPPSPSVEVGAQVRADLSEALVERAAGLADRDWQRFRGSLRGEDRGFRRAQRIYFDNLGQLPLAEVGFELDERTLAPDGEHYWGEVLVTLQLDGYDAVPVTTRDRFRFSPSPEGQQYVVSATTGSGRPWDDGPVLVEESDGVLGIFDEETHDEAQRVLESVSFARFDVAREVPAAGLVDVVVHAPGDAWFLEELPGLPVSDPQRLDAVTVPVPASADRQDGPIASYRVVINPRVLDDDLRALDRLLRHELTHVALGDRALGAPLWISEGIAEWVSVQPLAPGERMLPAAALDLARDGLSRLPEDAAFSGEGAEAWYAVSWWICEYVAATWDASYLWRLLDRLADGDDSPTAVEEMLGVAPRELVDRAMAMMLEQYEPEPPTRVES